MLQPPSVSGLIRPLRQYCLPQESDIIIQVRVSRCKCVHTMFLLPNFVNSKLPLLGARTVNIVSNGRTSCCLLHPNPYYVTIYPNQPLGFAQSVSPDYICAAGSTPTTPSQTDLLEQTPPSNPDTSTNILDELGLDRTNSPLNDTQKQQLSRLIAQYRDVFAKDSSELGVTDLISHHIDTSNLL